MNVTEDPITVPFWNVGMMMCPVNVHWHVETEHLSVGKYDETGGGPATDGEGTTNSPREGHRRWLQALRPIRSDVSVSKLKSSLSSMMTPITGLT